MPFDFWPKNELKLLNPEAYVEFFNYLLAFCENFRSNLLFLRLVFYPWGRSQSARRCWYLGWVIILRLCDLGSPPSLFISFLNHCGVWVSIWLKTAICCCRSVICDVILVYISFGFVRVRLLSARKSYCSIYDRIIDNIFYVLIKYQPSLKPIDNFDNWFYLRLYQNDRSPFPYFEPLKTRYGPRCSDRFSKSFRDRA
jgi:hypothetical protein